MIVGDGKPGCAEASVIRLSTATKIQPLRSNSQVAWCCLLVESTSLAQVDPTNWCYKVGDIDLTDPSIVVTDVNNIELPADATNKITVDAAAIGRLAPTAKTINFTAGATDQIEVVDPDQWRITEPIVVDGRFLLTAQYQNVGGEIIQVDSARPYRNFLQIGDVNNSGSVSAGDALDIIFELNSPRFRDATGNLVDPTQLDSFPYAILDVNGDGQATAADALNVINILFQQSLGGNGEGEQLVEFLVGSDLVAINQISNSTPMAADTPQPTIQPTQSIEASSSNITSSKVISLPEPHDNSIESNDEELTDAEFPKSLIKVNW